jgi:hypothetical protein
MISLNHDLINVLNDKPFYECTMTKKIDSNLLEVVKNYHDNIEKFKHYFSILESHTLD